MQSQRTGSNFRRVAKRSLYGRILRNTILNILVLVIVCCVIMGLAMHSLANNILLDSLQPMTRQSAKTVEANMHLLAERMMDLADDTRMKMVYVGGDESMGARPDEETTRENRKSVLEEAAEIYELSGIALYDLEGNRIQGIDDAPDQLGGSFFTLLQGTDNLTIHPATIFEDKLGIAMGMPVKENGETIFYVACIFKYDILSDVIRSISIGKNGTAYIVNKNGVVVVHTDSSKVLSQKTLKELSGGDENTLAHVTTGETGAAEFSVGNDEVMMAFSPVRGTQWALVIQIPKSDYNYLINGAMMVAVMATLAVLLISVLLVLRLCHSIARPVKDVTGRIIALSDGDLHTEVIQASSRDELELLTRTLDDTVRSVNHYISDIRQVLNQVAGGNLNIEPQVDYKGDFILIRDSLNTIIRSLNDTISGFRAAALRLTSMSEELNEQSGQLHEASVEQNRATEELVHEVSHVKEHLVNVTESSTQTRCKTEEMEKRIHEANGHMSSLTEAMDNISANANEITKIAKAIEDIAFQTNILAINASVEASRAGTAGKGFVVVVNEVKQLASKSAEAAQSATEMVGNTRAIIQTGVELTADTAESLHMISEISSQISEISDQLVDAVKGQENALVIMDERIESISDIADKNLQNAGGTKNSSGLLAKEAEQLKVQVNKFVCKQEAKGR